MPLSLISQYLPNQYREIRDGRTRNKARDLVVSRIREVLALYSPGLRPVGARKKGGGEPCVKSGPWGRCWWKSCARNRIVPLTKPVPSWDHTPAGRRPFLSIPVARLGHRAGIIGGVGLDGFGRNLLDRLENDGVNTDFVVICPGGSTAVAFVTYFQDGSRQFIFHIKGTPAEMVQPPRIDQVHMADYFHVMGCSLMISEEFRQTIIDTARLFREKGADITLDPNYPAGAPERARIFMKSSVPFWEQCTILMPGEEELHLLSGKEINETGALDIQRQYGVQYVVLKRGRKGATVYGPDQVVESPSFPVDEVDPTGGG